MIRTIKQLKWLIEHFNLEDDAQIEWTLNMVSPSEVMYDQPADVSYEVHSGKSDKLTFILYPKQQNN